MKDLKYYMYTLALVAALMMVVTDVFAQSNQYQRPGKKATASDASVKPAGTDNSKTDNSKSEKLDIQKVENEYWQQKDTDFHVVQNRRYAKEGRIYTSLGLGPVINDGFSRGYHGNFAVGSYFKEQHGWEVSYSHFSLDDSKTTKELLSLGAKPNHNKATDQLAVTYNWMPIYGKISLFDQSIIYFDMGILAGVGVAAYDQQQQEGNNNEMSPMLVLDISQQFFISEHFAFRFDVKNRVYKQDIQGWRTSDTSKKSDTEHSLSAVFGLIFYF